jgi:hypothetical protein
VNKNPILTNYVSDIDLLLQNFDKEHPEPSKSQQKEQKKYKTIHHLRDQVVAPNETKKLWDKF